MTKNNSITNLELMQSLSNFQDKMDSDIDNNLKIYFQNNENFSFINETSSKLILDEESHTYFFISKDGKSTKINDDLAWSATNYMKNYDDKFNFDKIDIPKYVLERAAKRGTNVHEKLENRKVLNFENQLKSKFDVGVNNFREVIIWDKKNKLVGMIDLIDFVIEDNKILIKIIDHKVSRRDKVEYLSYQLNMYSMVIDELISFLGEEFGLDVYVDLIGNQIYVDGYDEYAISRANFRRITIDQWDNSKIINILETARKNYNG